MAEELLVNVAQGEIGDQLVFGSRWGIHERLGDHLHGEGDVPHREHGSLGRAGGARRVDQIGDVLWLHLRHQVPHGVWVLVPVRTPHVHELVPRHENWVVVGVDAARLDVDDLLQVRQLVLDCQCFVDLFLILGHEHLRA